MGLLIERGVYVPRKIEVVCFLFGNRLRMTSDVRADNKWRRRCLPTDTPALTHRDANILS